MNSASFRTRKAHTIQDRGISSHIIILEQHPVTPEDEARARNYIAKHAPDLLSVLMPEDTK